MEHAEQRRFPAAPWPRSLKVVSAAATVLLVVLGTAAYRSAPPPPGFTHAFGVTIAMVFPAILLFSLLFMVTGYAMDGATLCIERPLFSTRIPLAGLQRVFTAPSICKGSRRVFGNGGLFSFTGLYQNEALGRYRLFATDFSRCVVLVLRDRRIVITPEDPSEFIAHIHRFFPSTQVGPEG